MGEKVLSIAESFSPYPAGRYRTDGPFSGERFRDDFLLPTLIEAQQNGDEVIVDLDGAFTYSSSFLEEAFGGLVRAKKIPASKIGSILKIKAEDLEFRAWKIDAENYIKDEMGRQKS